MSGRVLENKATVESIPERRPENEETAVEEAGEHKENAPERAGVKVWRCRVCGYLCARDKPPELCPICKVTRDRFEPFEFG